MSGTGQCQSEMHLRRYGREKRCTFQRFQSEDSRFSRKSIFRVFPWWTRDLRQLAAYFRSGRGLAPNLRNVSWLVLEFGGYAVKTNSPKKEQRKWARLHLAIPVFVRSQDGNGKESLEFANAVNISAGGALVIVRRSLAKSTPVSLEIPSAPIGSVDGVHRSSRAIRARTVWVTHLNDYHLLGVKFLRPLSTDAVAVSRSRLRKASSAM